MHKPLLLAFAIPFLTQCTSTPQPEILLPSNSLQRRITPLVHSTKRKPNDHPLAQHRLVGPSIYTGVRIPERLTTYHIGRTLIPGQGMREAHRIYTVQEPSHWNLSLSKPKTSQPGNAPAIHTQTPITDDEINAEKRHQREISARLESMEAQMDVWKIELKDLLNAERAKLSAPTTNGNTPPTQDHGN